METIRVRHTDENMWDIFCWFGCLTNHRASQKLKLKKHRNKQTKMERLFSLLVISIITFSYKTIDASNISDILSHRKLIEKSPVLPDSVSAWLSSAITPLNNNEKTNKLLSKVERRVSPIDGGATMLYTPNSLQRGEYHLDTTMSCIGWRETIGCDPYNAVLSHKPQSCSYNVDTTSSGYCECQISSPSGPIVKFGHTTCGHSSFRCYDICKLPPKRQCKGFILMDTCDPLPAGVGENGGWDFLNSKATTCNVNIHNVPLNSIPSCWTYLSSSFQCHDIINSTLAGYCECGSSSLRPEAINSGGLTRVRLECGHTPLTCNYICNSDSILQTTKDIHPHMPKDRYIPLPPSYLSWAWHSKPGIWNSIQSDYIINNNKISTSTNNVEKGIEYSLHCMELFQMRGHGASNGCIGSRPKWTLSLVSSICM